MGCGLFGRGFLIENTSLPLVPCLRSRISMYVLISCSRHSGRFNTGNWNSAFLKSSLNSMEASFFVERYAPSSLCMMVVVAAVRVQA